MRRSKYGRIAYTEALAMLPGRKTRKKLCNNTYLDLYSYEQRQDLEQYGTKPTRNANDPVYIRYHHTDIITLDKAGNIILDNGGWKTVTTKDRLGSFSGFSVWTEDGDWVVRGADGILYEFTMGMTINPQGIPDTIPVFVSVLSNIMGKQLETATETAIAIEGLNLAETESLWKKCWKHRDFIAKYCIEKFLPMTIGYRTHRNEPVWQTVVANRLRGVTNACTLCV